VEFVVKIIGEFKNFNRISTNHEALPGSLDWGSGGMEILNGRGRMGWNAAI
jgi:hypothetical protein